MKTKKKKKMTKKKMMTKVRSSADRKDRSSSMKVYERIPSVEEVFLLHTVNNTSKNYHRSLSVCIL